MTYAGYVVAKVVVLIAVVTRAMIVPAIEMMVVMMMRVIPIVVIPAPMVPIIGTIPVVVVVPPRAVIAIVVGIIVSVIVAGIESPVPGVANINIGVASAVAGVVVVIIVQRRAGPGAETFDASRVVGIVIGLGGGVNHTVGIGHGLRGLIHGGGSGLIVLAVGIIGLIVV